MSEKTATAAKTAHEPDPRAGRREPPHPAVPGLAASLLDAQRAAGNRRFGRLLGGAVVQPRLRIGPADDPYEREADHVADVLVGTGAGEPAAPLAISALGAGNAGVQRKCAKCQEEERRERAEAGGGSEIVQRQCRCHEDEETVQRKCHCQEEPGEEVAQPKAGGAPARGTDRLDRQVASLRGSGRALPADLRRFFEPRLGQDLAAVRVHTGAVAGEAARTAGARAFTVGRDVVFGAGEWAPGTRAGRRLLAHELTHVVQQTPLVARRKPLAERAPLESGEDGPAEATPEDAAPVPGGPEGAGPEPAAPGPEEPAAEPAAAGPAPAAVVVEDGAGEVGEGQMARSEFIARLRAEVCAATEASLAGTSYSAQGCPLIEFWFGYYGDQGAERINRDLPRLLPEGPPPATAEGYIAAIARRVRASVATWVRTGEITGVPPDLPLPGMNLPGVSSSGAGAASLGVSFKARAGGPRNPGDPRALRDSLGAGRPLDGSLRARMESVFGRSFAHVRAHTDAKAASTAERLNARAFAVGNHVAFGRGEYRPGTLVGDALVAHELAHVAQQDGAEAGRAGGGASGALERDADLAAAGAVMSLWGGRRLMPAPRLRSGLRLQRCDCNGGGKKEAPGTAPAAPEAGKEAGAAAKCCDFDSYTASDDTYTGDPPECRKTIKFTVKMKPLADQKKCVLVNWVQGAAKNKDGSFRKAKVFGKTVDINFPSEQIDSVDTDPVYWSDSSGRWNYSSSGDSFEATDSPGPRTWVDGIDYNLKFKMCLYCIDDVSATSDVSGSGVKNPLKCINWDFKAKYDAAKGKCEH